MTIVVPCRLITRQRSHMGLTDALTFISPVPVGNSASGQVIGRELDLHSVAGKDPDVVFPHLPGDRGEHRARHVVDLDPEHRAWKGLDDLAFDLDLLFLLCHSLRTEPRVLRS